MDLQENIKELFPWAAVKEYGSQVEDMGETLSSPAVEAKQQIAMRKM